MGIRTAIEYCDSTVNPIMGCTGCELYPDHCYAATLCARYAGRKGWPKQFNRPEFFPGRMEKAIGWPDLTGVERPDKPWLSGAPRVIFVNDLSDGFCPDVEPEEWLLPHLAGMGESSHIWLLLTKWPKRMKQFAAQHPLPDNVWPGVTMLRQGDEWRVGELIQMSAAVRYVSCEPLLGLIDLSRFLDLERIWNGGGVDYRIPPGHEFQPWRKLDWIIVGGESGPNARPMHPDWARDIRNQCRAAGTRFLFKQWGAWAEPHAAGFRLERELLDDIFGGKFKRVTLEPEQLPGGWVTVHRVGKKAAGRLLDGREWNEWPT